MPTTTEPCNEPIRVSIVEDDARTRQLFSDIISTTAGFRLVGAYPDGKKAVAALAADPPSVVLVDINLPGMNGIECVRRAKPLVPETQFIMVTVYEDAEHIFGALQAGATGYLLKSTARDELIQAIRDVRLGGSPMTSHIARKVVQSFQKSSLSPELPSLSEREVHVLDLLTKGFIYKEIADVLKVSVHTVNTYCRRIYEKLHVCSRTQAIARYRGEI
jgi:DNA-binding NarL/FixJ family response regulator